MSVEIFGMQRSGGGGGGSGDVVGPAGATDNAIARFDGVTGKLLQNSTAILADNGSIVLTSVSANALAVGANGATNPVFNVDASAASPDNGLSIISDVAGNGVTLQVISTGSPDHLILSSKGGAGIVAVNGQLQASFNQGNGFHALEATCFTTVLNIQNRNTNAFSAILFTEPFVFPLIMGYSNSTNPVQGGKAVILANAVDIVMSTDNGTTQHLKVDTTGAVIASGTLKGTLTTLANATTGLGAGILAALTNASIVITDGTGQVYRVPCII